MKSSETPQFPYNPCRIWATGEFAPPPACRQLPPQKIVRGLENTPKPTFSSFSPSKTGASSTTPSVTAPCTAVQPRCIPLQNFAFCAMADPLQSPTARLSCRFVCTTSGFAQKKDARPVGGRGISAFSDVFLLGCLIFQRTLIDRCVLCVFMACRTQ